MSNMDDFNKGAALIFAKLYDIFPRPIEFTISELDAEASKDCLINYVETMDFLKAEEFITSNIIGGFDEDTIYHNVRLTNKGLAVLNSIPEILHGNPSLGHQVTDLVKSGSKNLATEGAKQIAKILISNIIQAAATGHFHLTQQ